MGGDNSSADYTRAMFAAQPPADASVAELSEWSDLPEEAAFLTFRGRYSHIDRYVMKLAGVARLPRGSELAVLDIAGGVRPYGSPTAHDLHQAIFGLGMTPRITVADRHIPADLRPSRPDIVYTGTLPPAGARFDIVRMLNLVSYLTPGDYAELRRQAVSRLRPGGLFVTTQRHVFKPGWPDEALPTTLTKVMQLREVAGERALVTVALLPDVAHPCPRWNIVGVDERPAEYRRWRNGLISSGEPIPRRIDLERNRVTLEALSHRPPLVLEREAWDELPWSAEPQWDPLATTAAAARGTARRFVQGFSAPGRPEVGC
jgi:hypothetical protein